MASWLSRHHHGYSGTAMSNQGTQLRFRPKFDKIIELLLYFAHKTQYIDHYQASKLVYLCDYIHLNRFRRPTTFDIHTAMQHGPVATKTYEILKGEKKALAEAGVTELPFHTSCLDNIIIVGSPKRSVDYDVFSKSDITVADEVLAKYGNLPFAKLHDITSKHFAYQKAWNTRKGDAKSAVMSYDDLFEESALKEDYLEDYGPVSANM